MSDTPTPSTPIPSQKLLNAKGLYMEGIRDGRVEEATEKYIGDRYIQHSTGVRDGVEGFREFFTEFLERTPQREIEVIRAIEDGNYVFLHVHQVLNGGEAEWITADLFDTDDEDKIIEHWDVIAPVSATSVSGHTQLDGATEVTDLAATEANKEIVRRFLTEIFQEGRIERASEYISTESYIQHNPNVADGIEGLEAFVAGLAEQGVTMRCDRIHRLIGQGNFVVSLTEVTFGDDAYAAFDIFRLEEGKIVEHWDNAEPIPPEAEWANSGKF